MSSLKLTVQGIAWFYSVFQDKYKTVTWTGHSHLFHGKQLEPKESGFMSLQIMTPAEARRDTKNLFHEMSVFTLQNLTDLTEEDGSLNSKVQGFYKRDYEW